MKIQELQNAYSQIERIGVLTKELSELQDFAMKVKDESLKLNLSLSYDKPKIDYNSIINDDDIPRMIDHPFNSPIGGFFSGLLNRNKPVPDNKESFKLEVSEVVTLEILGVIAAHKEAERMAIVAQLKSQGITVEQ